MPPKPKKAAPAPQQDVAAAQAEAAPALEDGKPKDITVVYGGNVYTVGADWRERAGVQAGYQTDDAGLLAEAILGTVQFKAMVRHQMNADAGDAYRGFLTAFGEVLGSPNS